MSTDKFVEGRGKIVDPQRVKWCSGKDPNLVIITSTLLYQSDFALMVFLWD
jgi:hypothetical protein